MSGEHVSGERPGAEALWVEHGWGLGVWPVAILVALVLAASGVGELWQWMG